MRNDQTESGLTRNPWRRQSRRFSTHSHSWNSYRSRLSTCPPSGPTRSQRLARSSFGFSRLEGVGMTWSATSRNCMPIFGLSIRQGRLGFSTGRNSPVLFHRSFGRG